MGANIHVVLEGQSRHDKTWTVYATLHWGRNADLYGLLGVRDSGYGEYDPVYKSRGWPEDSGVVHCYSPEHKLFGKSWLTRMEFQNVVKTFANYCPSSYKHWKTELALADKMLRLIQVMEGDARIVFAFDN